MSCADNERAKMTGSLLRPGSFLLAQHLAHSDNQCPDNECPDNECLRRCVGDGTGRC